MKGEGQIAKEPTYHLSVQGEVRWHWEMRAAVRASPAARKGSCGHGLASGGKRKGDALLRAQSDAWRSAVPGPLPRPCLSKNPLNPLCLCSLRLTVQGGQERWLILFESELFYTPRTEKPESVSWSILKICFTYWRSHAGQSWGHSQVPVPAATPALPFITSSSWLFLESNPQWEALTTNIFWGVHPGPALLQGVFQSRNKTSLVCGSSSAHNYLSLPLPRFSLRPSHPHPTPIHTLDRLLH